MRSVGVSAGMYGGVPLNLEAHARRFARHNPTLYDSTCHILDLLIFVVYIATPHRRNPLGSRVEMSTQWVASHLGNSAWAKLWNNMSKRVHINLVHHLGRSV